METPPYKSAARIPPAVWRLSVLAFRSSQFNAKARGSQSFKDDVGAGLRLYLTLRPQGTRSKILSGLGGLREKMLTIAALSATEQCVTTRSIVTR